MPEYPFNGSENENVWNLTIANAPIVEVFEERLLFKGVRLFLKREDKLHPEVSGNKWRKLKYNLLEAKKQGKEKILTFGGAYSNHIAAVAAAAQAMGFQSIGVIRGEAVLPLNSTLKKARDNGMQFKFISRTEYRNKTKEDFIQKLQKEFGDFYLIPEGGTNCLALQGVGELIADISNYPIPTPDFICTAMGTGGTIAGLISNVSKEKKVLGFSVLKGDFLEREVEQLLSHCKVNHIKNWEVFNDYHFGGYAKYKKELIHFINTFKRLHHIPLDPIYTGKMLYGVFDLIEKNYFEKGSNVLAIHTGGLQGIEGFNQRYGDLII